MEEAEACAAALAQGDIPMSANSCASDEPAFATDTAPPTTPNMLTRDRNGAAFIGATLNEPYAAGPRH